MGKRPARKEQHPTQGRKVELLHVLNASAARLQRSARSEELVYQNFSEQISLAGLVGGIAMLDETGRRIVVRAAAYPDRSQLLARMEKLTGLKMVGFSFDRKNSGIYGRVIDSGQSEYVENNNAIIVEVLPEIARPSVDVLLGAFGGQPGIYSPVTIEGQTQGLIGINGPGLTTQDVPAIEAFANQVSVALENARLIASMRQELDERQRIENALQESETRFRALAETTASAIFIYQGAKFLYVNPAMEALSGYSHNELLSMNFWDIVHPDDANMVRERGMERQQGGSPPKRYELRIVMKSGDVHWVDFTGEIIQVEGRPAGLGTAFDITERKRAEEELRRVNEFNEGIVQSVFEGIALQDEAGYFKFVNPAAAAMLGFTPEEMVGQHWSQTVPEDQRAAIYSADQRRKHGVADRYELELMRKDGTRISVQVSGAPRFENGRFVGTLVAFTDITDRKRAEESARRRAEEQSAIAAENARLLEAERAIRAQAETLRDVSQAMNRSLKLDEVLRLILEQLKRVLTFDTASVLLYNEQDKPAIATGIGYSDEQATSQVTGDLLKSSPILAEMARSLEPVIIPDVREHPGWIWVPGAEHVRSFLGVPIVSRDRMIGVLMADNTNTCFFRSEDARVAQALAQHMSIAIQNARLFEAERAQLLLARTLQEVAAVLTSELRLDDVLESILDLLGRVVNYDSVSVHLIDEMGKLYLAAGRGFPDIEQARQTVRTLSVNILAVQWADQQRLVMPDTYNDPRWTVTPDSAYIRSWVGAPLLVKGQMIGSLNVDSRSINAYDISVADTVMAFANQAAIAIANARLFEAAEKRAAELEALRQASLSLTASLELEAVLYAILESTLKLLPGAQNAHIFLYHPDEDDGRLAFGAALWSIGRRGFPVAQPRSSGLTYSVARTGQPIVVSNMLTHPLFQSAPIHDPNWQGAIIGIPLKIGQGVVGVMNVSFPKPRNFSEAEQRLIQFLGDQAAIAIENARLFQEAATERRHVRLLYDIGQALVVNLDADSILDIATRLTCQAMDGMVGEAFLYVPETGQLSLRALTGLDGVSPAELDPKVALKPGRGLAGWVAENREAVSVPEVDEDPRWLHIAVLNQDAHSVVAAPIVDGERLLGVILVLHRLPAAFSKDHLELLQAICKQVGLALINAERYQQVQSLVDLLAAEQYRLESLIEYLPVGVILLDNNYRIQTANPLGREILVALGSGEPGDVLSTLGSCSLSELMARHDDPLPTEIILESTPRRLFEAQTRPIAGESHQWVLTVREVTRERENLARIQMQERLATVGQLAAGIAHDFNNIMAAIMVYTDLLLADTSLLPTSRERLGIIEQQIKRASSLIRQILDFSRRSVMEQTPIDLLPFLKELNKLLRRVLPETIHLELTYHSDSYLITADPTRLQQAFMNLALNARDAMPEGGTIRFTLNHVNFRPGDPLPLPDMPYGDWIRITAEDTGVGMTLDVRNHIFEPFFTTKPVGQGTGLGLSQVYGIVKQHQGYIDVESRMKEGTKFTIFLPALAVPEIPPGQEPSPAHFDGAGRTVLVVEDDATTRDALQTLLRAYNFWVLTASNGIEALRILNQAGRSIALVVSDVVMPEMGGVSLLRTIQPRWPLVKVLLITGHPLEMQDRALLEMGAVHWLQKPFSVGDFSNAIQGLLRG